MSVDAAAVDEEHVRVRHVSAARSLLEKAIDERDLAGAEGAARRAIECAEALLEEREDLVRRRPGYLHFLAESPQHWVPMLVAFSALVLATIALVIAT